MWPFSHLLALPKVSKAHDKGINMRAKMQKAPPHNWHLKALVNNLLSMVPMFAIAWYANMVFPVLDIIEEAKDKEQFWWMAKVIGRDLVTNLTVIGVWSWYVDYFNKNKFRQVKFL